jgi:hypothetical protein
MVFVAKATAACQIQFYEGCTADAPGTEIITARLNRGSTKTTKVKIYHTPTNAVLGTELPGDYIPSAGPGGGSGGEAAVHEGAEWMLKANTNYVVELTNSSATTFVKFEWYE